MSSKQPISINAFASGQIGSKLWLCDELERVCGDLKITSPQTLWLLGGWYALTAFLLFSRQNMPLQRVRSFDIDEEATATADILLENWVWQEWKFKAFTQDIYKLDFQAPRFDGAPDWVVNTSCEHFLDTKWFQRVPSQTNIVLQSNDMEHEEHVSKTMSSDELQNQFELSEVYFKGEKTFTYPDSKFTRHMIIGKK